MAIPLPNRNEQLIIQAQEALLKSITTAAEATQSATYLKALSAAFAMTVNRDPNAQTRLTTPEEPPKQ